MLRCFFYDVAFSASKSVLFRQVYKVKFVGIGKTFCSFAVGFALPTDIAGISVGVVTDSTQYTSDGKADCYAVFELTPSGCQKSRLFQTTLSLVLFVRM